MTTSSPFIKRLKVAATKAAARAVAAKTQVRAAKVQLKQARKLFKTEKKAAKQAQRKVEAAATSAAKRAPRPAATLKLKPAVRKSSATQPVRATQSVRATRKIPQAAPKNKPKKLPKKAAKKAAEKAPKMIKPRRPAKARTQATGMRSAAEVAKSVIERLHAPPPILPHAPVLQTDPSSGSGHESGEKNRDQDAQEERREQP
jgi:hypothetical protein